MLTVVKYGSHLYYLVGTFNNPTNVRCVTGLRVDNGTLETLYQYDCRFQYFVDDKGHKLDLNFKRLKEKQ